jgi:hypothetical protein
MPSISKTFAITENELIKLNPSFDFYYVISHQRELVNDVPLDIDEYLVWDKDKKEIFIESHSSLKTKPQVRKLEGRAKLNDLELDHRFYIMGFLSFFYNAIRRNVEKYNDKTNVGRIVLPGFHYLDEDQRLALGHYPLPADPTN